MQAPADPFPTAPRRPTVPSTRRPPRAAGRRGGIFGLFLHLPMAVVQTGARLVLSAAGIGVSFVACLLPGPVLQALQGELLRLTIQASAASSFCTESPANATLSQLQYWQLPATLRSSSVCLS